MVILTGNNRFLLGQALKERLATFVSAHDAMAVERFDGEQLEAERLHEIIHALPFLTAQRMVVIKNVSKNKTTAEKLQEMLEKLDIPETTELLIVEEAPDKRSSFYKFLSKQPGVENYDELAGPALTKWLQDAAEKRGGKLGRSEAEMLVDRLGPDQLQLSNELDKLIAYNANISRESIELLTERSPQSTVFELLDSAFQGNIKKTLELYSEQRAQRVEPLAILGMIAWQLHILAVVKTAGDRDPAAIASDAKISPFVVRKTVGIARRVSLEQVKAWVQAALELDVSMKSKAINADDALQHLLISFSEQATK